MNPAWQKWDPIGQEIDPSKLEDLADALNRVAGTLEDLAGAAEIVEAYLAADPITALLSAVGNAFSALISGLEQTDIYALPLLPHSWRDLLHPYTIQDAIIDVQSALADRQDPNRPLFGAQDVQASITILVGADNWADFRRLVKIFGSMFSDYQMGKWARFADLRLELDKWRRRSIPRPERGTHGETWDWYKTNLIELIPPIGDVLRRLRDLADSLVGIGMGLGGALKDLIDVLNDRIDYIRQVIEEIAVLARFLADIHKLVPSSSVLFTFSRGGDSGTQEYVRQMEAASNRPEYKLVAGITLLTGTADPEAYLEALKRILMVQTEGAVAAARNAAAAGGGQ